MATEISRVIIISKDNVFKISLLRELRENKELEVIITPMDILSLNGILIKDRLNVIIIDIENQVAMDPYFRKLQSEYSINAILVGFNPVFKLTGITGFIQKPKLLDDSHLKVFCKEIVRRIDNFKISYSANCKEKTTSTILCSAGVLSTSKLIAIASSTGGTDALPIVLSELPENSPPILVVQHMPAVFTKHFAERLDKICRVRVCEASNGEPIINGTVYIAPGDYHMEVMKRGNSLSIRTTQAEKILGLRPAADILFSSLLSLSPKNVIGVILTGMGADGARGLLELKNKGAKVIGQNQETCIVYGMPKVAFDIGAVDFQLPIERIANKIIELS